MSKLIAIMSMSLDGFIAGPDERLDGVFSWYFRSGPIAIPTGGADSMTLRLSEASAAANGKNVAVHGANVIQQLLNAGLLDEINVDVAAVVLGYGIRLFENLASAPVVLGSPTVIAGNGVTHLRYTVG